MSHLVFFFTRSPEESNVVTDAFDAVITAAIFDKKISLVFEEKSWNNFLSKNDHEDTTKVIASKLQTLSSMSELNILIKSNKPSQSSENRKIKRTLTHFFDEASCKSKFISNDDFQSLLKESDKVLSY